MKKRLAFKTLCCLPAVCMLLGCTGESKLLAIADDDTYMQETTVDGTLFDFKGYRIVNAEGKELHYVSFDPEHSDNYHGPEGTMEFTDSHLPSFNDYENFWSEKPFCNRLRFPFTKRFTFERYQNEEESWSDKTLSEFTFCKEEKEKGVRTTTRQSVFGFCSKVVHHCNNVIELEGDLSDLLVGFNVKVFAEPTDTEISNFSYLLRVDGGDRVVVALIDGKIVTEGMASGYTTRTRAQTQDNETMAVINEYDKDGNLLNTSYTDLFGNPIKEEPAESSEGGIVSAKIE